MGLWAKLNQPVGTKLNPPDVEWKEEDGRRFLRVVAVWDGWKLVLVFGISLIPAVLGLLASLSKKSRLPENGTELFLIYLPAILAVLGPASVAILIRPKCIWKFYDEKFTRSSLWRLGGEQTHMLSRIRAAVRVTKFWKPRILLRTDDDKVHRLPGKEEVRAWAEEHFTIHEDEQKAQPLPPGVNRREKDRCFFSPSG
ncbi:MAG: hypothetical protein JXA11_06790 [Phycisphaerae bacterium]|nr:hypothetical protein [Phycisphaerae bacterium]